MQHKVKDCCCGHGYSGAMSKTMIPLPMVQPPSQAGLEIDPICGMTVDPAQAAGSSHYAGRTYYFCNLSCLKTFQADPGRCISK